MPHNWAIDDIMGQHVDECEEYPVGCPRKCNGSERLKRKNLRNHAEVCPLEPVRCPYSEVGCDPCLMRKDLNAHMKSNLENHMLKIMTAHTKFIAEHDKLKSDHTRLKNDFDKLTQECATVKTELAETQAKHTKVAENFTKMVSSISLEMDFIGKGRDNDTSMQCIKTVLDPKMKDSKAKLAFRVPPITRRWTSPPFYVLDGYKMVLVFSKDDHQRSILTTVRWPGSATALPAHTNSTTSVSLQLLKGESDAQLKWPTDSSLNLEVRVASASSRPVASAATLEKTWQMSEKSHEQCPQETVIKTQSPHGGTQIITRRIVRKGDSVPAKPRYTLIMSLKLSQYLKQKVVEENIRELKRDSIGSQLQGPWIVTLSLSVPQRSVNPLSMFQPDKYYYQ